MALENARKFIEMVREDEALQDRTANRGEEEVMAIARELGLDFTPEEMKEAARIREISADELDSAAGGRMKIFKIKRRQQAEGVPDEEGHIWYKIGHYEDEWFSWLKKDGLFSFGYDIYECSHCGKQIRIHV